ncbi:hypothetical protein ACHQM5_001424 [Ranunculus cassubicifolius]
MSVPFFSLIALFLCLVTTTAVVIPQADECERNCGDISVPNPFGLDNCPKNSLYNLHCNRSVSPPRLFLDTIPMLSISLENATAVVEIDIAYTCYDQSGEADKSSQYAWMGDSPFLFSTHNKFTTIGCDTIGYVGDENFVHYSGCVSVCNSSDTNQYNFTEELISCGGIGCCQTSVPKEFDTLGISLTSYKNHSDQLDTNPCSFGFMSDPSWYKDHSNFTLSDTADKHGSSPVVLDWAIRGNITCEDTEDPEYICGSNSNCISSYNGPGYLCNCNKGFIGNPYTKTGCQDINECHDPATYPCNGKCKNIAGNYTCGCSFGKHGDGKIGCRISTASKIAIGIGAACLFVTFVLFLVWLHKKQIKQLNLRKNGGAFLDQLSLQSFKESQLEKATNNFDSKNLLGEGGNGWVYKGIIDSMLYIAVKKSKLVDQNQIEQFINEADIVSKINHKNVVKLLGLCVESKVPMLVYDFIPNGTLYQHLHGKKSRILDSWRICLRIAADTARALDYMHSQANPPIIHRDVKTSNILLDETYTAKVADFGASKLIPLNRTMAETQGQGTMGYLDPEYVQTGELTTMSDVYSFGVVLMEILSKQKAIIRGSSKEITSLVMLFTSAVENNRFDEIVKVADVTEHETEQVHLVADLAIRCVAMPSKRRPTMTEVADVLNVMSKEYKFVPVEGYSDETVNLLDDQESMTTSVHFEISME